MYYVYKLKIYIRYYINLYILCRNGIVFEILVFINFKKVILIVFFLGLVWIIFFFINYYWYDIKKKNCMLIF